MKEKLLKKMVASVLAAALIAVNLGAVAQCYEPTGWLMHSVRYFPAACLGVIIWMAFDKLVEWLTEE